MSSDFSPLGACVNTYIFVYRCLYQFTILHWILKNNYTLCFFASPLLKVKVSFSDHILLSIVRPSIRSSVRLSINISHFYFFSRHSAPSLTNLDRKHPSGNFFRKGYNCDSVKIGWVSIKIFLRSTRMPISTPKLVYIMKILNCLTCDPNQYFFLFLMK